MKHTYILKDKNSEARIDITLLVILKEYLWNEDNNSFKLLEYLINGTVCTVKFSNNKIINEFTSENFEDCENKLYPILTRLENELIFIKCKINYGSLEDLYHDNIVIKIMEKLKENCIGNLSDNDFICFVRDLIGYDWDK